MRPTERRAASARTASFARFNAGAGKPTEVSPVLFRAISEALRAARLTDGLVDPTVGQALVLAGYDRDFHQVDPDGPPLTLAARSVPGWQTVTVDPTKRSVRLPAGVTLDLGATAKASCADLAAQRIATATGTGVLVSLGGDIALAGPAPEEGWSIRITHDHATPPDQADGPVVYIHDGGLATSSTSVRRWMRGGTLMDHPTRPSHRPSRR